MRVLSHFILFVAILLVGAMNKISAQFSTCYLVFSESRSHLIVGKSQDVKNAISKTKLSNKKKKKKRKKRSDIESRIRRNTITFFLFWISSFVSYISAIVLDRFDRRGNFTIVVAFFLIMGFTMSLIALVSFIVWIVRGIRYGREDLRNNPNPHPKIKLEY